jgi:hypothetical protein
MFLQDSGTSSNLNNWFYQTLWTIGVRGSHGVTLPFDNAVIEF